MEKVEDFGKTSELSCCLVPTRMHPDSLLPGAYEKVKGTFWACGQCIPRVKSEATTLANLPGLPLLQWPLMSADMCKEHSGCYRMQLYCVAMGTHGRCYACISVATIKL